MQRSQKRQHCLPRRSKRYKPSATSKSPKSCRQFKSLLKSSKPTFSTIPSSQQQLNHIQYFSPILATSQSAMLQHLPESQQFASDLQHGRFASAEQALNRMDGIFQSLPMPALQIEVQLRKSKLYQAMGKFQQQSSALESILTQLENNIPFQTTLPTTWEAAEIQQNMPFLGRQLVVSSSPQSSDHAASGINKNLHIYYQSSPTLASYIPIISTLTLSYLHTHQFPKATALVRKFCSQLPPLPQNSATQCSDQGLYEAHITLSSLEGLIIQTELADSLFLDETKVQQFTEKNNRTEQKSTTLSPTPPKPKFVLKTTRVEQGAATLTRSLEGKVEQEQSSTPQPHKHNFDTKDTTLESTEAILKRKEECQIAQLEAQAREELQHQSTTQTSSESTAPPNKFPTVSLPFQSLLTSCKTLRQDNLEVETFLSRELLDEIDNLPISLSKLSTSTPRALFTQAFAHYIGALSLAQQSHRNSTSHTASQTTLILDSLTHLTSLFHALIAIQQSLNQKNTTLQSYATSLNLTQTTFLQQNIDGYQSLPNPTNLPLPTQLNAPFAISPHGPRVITKQLAIHSSNFTILNTALRSTEQLLSFSNTDKLQEYLSTTSPNDISNIHSQFQHLDQTKGTSLSPLLLAIGFEYLSLNPINTEGLARTALTYLEKQQAEHFRTFHHQQVLLDSYYSHGYILSNLSWNGKPRTAEALTTVFKGIDMLAPSGAANEVLSLSAYLPLSTSNSSSPQLFPRNLTFDVTNKFTNINSHAHFKATGTPFQWDNVKAHSLDYSITFRPVQRGIEQWVIERYSM